MTKKQQTEGEPTTSAPPEYGSADGALGDSAEERVEAPGASARDEPTETAPDDISGIENMLEEGAPLEPQDVAEEPLPAVDVEQALAERTADLQRLQAEYLNYKRRVDRDRDRVRENATYTALSPIVDVLDTIDRAREHGDLDEGLQAVADQLERVVTQAGLVKYGDPGDAFDPQLHEALSHIGEDPDVEVTTCKIVAKAGYRLGDRVVRAAQVLVVDPASS
ncbi:MAG: nucleotide exchange factor GrpE [Nocardioides sp.]